ncbi:fluoride efflux transporter CrcB [Mycolicibacterium thermoresistibile]
MATADLRIIAAVFVGGALGTVARAALAEFAAPEGGGWPWTTFLVNTVGACLLGYVAVRLPKRLPGTEVSHPLLGTGLCGGLTTFSTMQVEIVEMATAHRYGLAVGYLCTSIAVGLAAVQAGSAAARRRGRR